VEVGAGGVGEVIAGELAGGQDGVDAAQAGFGAVARPRVGLKLAAAGVGSLGR
jgi:hypothetical protein